MDEPDNLRRFHKILLTAGALTLAIYAIAVGAALWLFRGEVRHQILQRDGILLTSVAQHFYDTLALPGEDIDLLDVAFESSGLGGVIAVRLYGPEGELLGSVPADLYAVDLSRADVRQLTAGKPVMRHFPDLPLETLFSDESDFDTDGRHAVTEVLAPVTEVGGRPVAFIEYWLDGAEVEKELAQLDDHLLGLGSIFIAAGGAIFLLVFFYTRQRLLKMGRLLAERNRSLERANADLALAARTSAIGSVTSHLFHGLKNPLAGLKTYLRLTSHDDDEELVAIADRMQSLIDETLSVIREEADLQQFDLSLEEFSALANDRFAGAHPGQVVVETSGLGNIPARKAQLLLLVVRNLVENAVEASPADRKVRVSFTLNGGGMRAVVEDHGPGLPAAVRERLFEPVASAKANGTGIGLAISALIARHIPASLHLQHSGPDGTAFTLHMPL